MKKLSEKNIILNNSDIEKKIQRISLQILEDNTDEDSIVVFGVSDNGLVIAKKLINHLNKISNLKSNLIQVIIDKDDPIGSVKYDTKFDMNSSSVLFVDDVSQSGKTLQSVISNLLIYKPNKIKTAVIVNRDQTLFPVKIDYSGISLSTSVNEHVSFISNKNNELEVYLS